MRLRQVYLRRFRQFIDQRLDIDPYVTVLVGRNDTGKSGLLNRFFDQYVFNDVTHGGDRPTLVPGAEGDLVYYSLAWDIAADDYALFPLREALGRDGVSRLEMGFTDADRPAKYWTYRADGEDVVAYEGERDGQPIRRDVFRARRLLPQPHYLELSDQYVLRSEFEARLHGRYAGQEEPLPHRPKTEDVLLRMAGFLGETRPIGSRGIEEPWPTAVIAADIPTAAELAGRLTDVSARVTTALRESWDEPDDLTFQIELAGRADYQERLNSYLLTSSVRRPSGVRLHATGILWFVSFLVHILHVREHRRPTLLLFDEPGTPLHPKMQRVVAKIFDSISRERQVVYSTHSPFMVDWSYPQRLRLFRRDWVANRTHIEKPYRATTSLTGVWDPLLSSIGVSLGDIGVIGARNLLVEGITDQILLANISEMLRRRGRAALDLTGTSIIPYSEESVLGMLLAMCRGRRATAVVLCDADEQGRRFVLQCERLGIPYVVVGDYAARPGTDAAIEDVIGSEAYVAAVNRVYKAFDWYTPLEPTAVTAAQGERSLGAHLVSQFEQWGQSFSKVAVTVELIHETDALPAEVVGRVAGLLQAILDRFGA